MPQGNVMDDSDDIEIESIRCNFCLLDLTALSLSDREIHYEYHFINDSTDGSVEGSQALPIDLEAIAESSNSWKTRSDAFSTQRGSPKKKKSLFHKETDLFWYPAQRTPPPRNYIPGIFPGTFEEDYFELIQARERLIPVLRKGLLRCHNRGQLRRAALCFDKAVHIHRELWDASWGCGYRNFLMACAALMSQTQQPMYFPLLDSPLPPSIRNLQSWIEDAWKEGFDAEGKTDLKKLIGTNKWIGTADIWVAFVSRRIPAQLVDFDFRNRPGGPETLINWVVQYFTPQGLKGTQGKSMNAFDSMKLSPITMTTKMPLILQHDGHSRTVVGYEVDGNGVTNLLVFDPAYRPTAEISNYALSELGFKSDSIKQGSSMPLSGQSSNTVDMASPSVSKRKCSLNTSPQSTKQPRMGENIQVKPHPSPAQTFKKGLSKVGLSHSEKEFDPSIIIKRFRLEPKNLEKKKQYQILYFPMTAPLTDRERLQRKIVTSINIT